MKAYRFLFILFVLSASYFRVSSQVILVAEKTDSSVISNLFPVGEKLFFTSFSSDDSIEIWVIESSLNSSQMIKKLPNFSGIVATDPLFFFEFKGNLIFTAMESFSVDETGYPDVDRYLWKSDGTIEGTIKLKKLETWFYLDDDIPNTWGGSYIQLGDKLLFSATSPDTLNFELWSTDGTAEGTTNLLEINKNNLLEPYYAPYRSSSPSSLTKMGNKMYFSANDAIHGQELWVTDGSAEGTHLLKDINPGENSSLDYYYHAEHFKSSNDKLFFTAFFGKQLWVSDGTEEGTQQIIKFNYSDTYEDYGIFIRNMDDLNGELYFEVHYWNYTNLTNDSLQLWKSDGTESGTQMVYRLDGMDISSFTSYNGNLFFLNSDNGLHELWKSDGTLPGTLNISEFQVPENFSSRLYSLNDSIYFAALDENNILKIWRSDGYSNGTVPMENWNETELTSITDLVLFKHVIYFAARHPDHGTALFKYEYASNIVYLESVYYLNDKLGISPNPAFNDLNIYLPGLKQDGIVSFYDAKGTRKISFTVHPDQKIIRADISELKNGFYIVTYTGYGETRTALLVKE